MHKQSHETFPFESRLVTRNRPPPIRRPPPRAPARRRTRRSTARPRDRARVFSNRAFVPRSRAVASTRRSVARRPPVRRSSRAAASAAESDPSDRPMGASRRCLAPAIDARENERTKGNTPASLARSLARVVRRASSVRASSVGRRAPCDVGGWRRTRFSRPSTRVFDGYFRRYTSGVDGSPSHDRTLVVCGRKALSKEDLLVHASESSCRDSSTVRDSDYESRSANASLVEGLGRGGPSTAAERAGRRTFARDASRSSDVDGTGPFVHTSLDRSCPRARWRARRCARRNARRAPRTPFACT